MPRTLQELLAWNPPEQNPVIKEGILPEGSFMVFWGDQETYKTWFMLELAWCVAQGEPWLTYKTSKHEVLIVNAELPEALYRDRVLGYARSKGRVPQGVRIETDLNFKLTLEGGLMQLKHWCSLYSPGLVIIDNLNRVSGGGLNDPRYTSMMLDNISTIRQEYGCAVVIVHHGRKETYDVMRGKRVWRGLQEMTGFKYVSDNASTIMEVRRYYHEGIGPAVIVIPEKTTYASSTLTPLRFKFEEDAQFSLIMR